MIRASIASNFVLTLPLLENWGFELRESIDAIGHLVRNIIDACQLSSFNTSATQWWVELCQVSRFKYFVRESNRDWQACELSNAVKDCETARNLNLPLNRMFRWSQWKNKKWCEQIFLCGNKLRSLKSKCKKRCLLICNKSLGNGKKIWGSKKMREKICLRWDGRISFNDNKGRIRWKAGREGGKIYDRKAFQFVFNLHPFEHRDLSNFIWNCFLNW